jgi:DNA helicase-2/ATP-dependent DNA helicase PcrA
MLSAGLSLTRAKKSVAISYAEQGTSGERLPSQFLSEIDPALVERLSTEDIEAEYAAHREVEFAPKINHGISVRDKEFIQTTFLEQGWSVTALNNYLTCPWNYFFTNLVRIPVAETKHQLYGTAVHAALRDFFKAYSRDEEWTAPMLVGSFEAYLSKLPVSSEDFPSTLEKGKRALKGYFEAYNGSWPRALLTEFSLSQCMLSVDYPDAAFSIPLRGVLDKIELLGDNEVCVVDYKTAKPQTRNEIMGLTKSASGDYFRQLVFYKMLLELSDTGYTMHSAEIDFIEPDTKGVYHREKFQISSDDMKKVRDILTQASREVYLGEFWNKRCDDTQCQYCKLRDMIGKN